MFKGLRDQGRPTPLDFQPKYDGVVDWYVDIFYRLKDINEYKLLVSVQLQFLRDYVVIGTADEFLHVMQALNIEYAKRIKKND